MSQTQTQTLQVEGMTCGHCEASVREEIAELSRVVSVEADHATGRVVVTSTEALDRAALAAAVDEAGYTLA